MNAYLLKFDEINSLKFENMSRDEIEDEFVQFLAEGYYLAIDELEKMLHKKVEAELDELEDIMWLEIEGKTFADRIDDHLAKEDYPGLMTLAESEFHRVYNNALYDGAKRSGAREKIWNTMEDDRVRETHDYLLHDAVGLDEKFYTFDGDSARFPGDFEKSENNVRCRCWLTYR